MNTRLTKQIRMIVFSLLAMVLPLLCAAGGDELKPGAPPIDQPLVSEGVFAVQLGAALGITSTDNEVEAESLLGDLGIAPQNGWIADYPVTPDIVMELQDAVTAAADEGRLPMGSVEAANRFDTVVASFGLAVRPFTPDTPYEPTAATCETYPNPRSIQTVYAGEGPPVVTYYCPPPDYYYLYSWVPSPFWWSDLWFPGFFILNDFHKVSHRHRKVEVITNHFNEPGTHRALRIDPVKRFSGKTYGGIGVPRSRPVIPSGVSRGERRIFNAPHTPPAYRHDAAPSVRGAEPRVREDGGASGIGREAPGRGATAPDRREFGRPSGGGGKQHRTARWR